MNYNRMMLLMCLTVIGKWNQKSSSIRGSLMWATMRKERPQVCTAIDWDMYDSEERLKLCNGRTIFMFLATTIMCQDKEKKTIVFAESEQLSFKSLIKRACASSLESSAQLITLTTLAISDAAERYRESMGKLIRLMNIWCDPNMSEYQKGQMWDEIIELRSKTEDLRKSFLEISGLMDYVDKMTTNVAEVAFVAGAEYVSTELCDRMNSARRKLQEENEQVKKLEQILMEYLHGLKEKPVK